ncbi:MAG: RnfABCDGE type electron transport complex subunit D [Eubacterium sp.]|nr:RnfABCDGE type electron transport complex subunit D [Eubacterium sp.]
MKEGFVNISASPHIRDKASTTGIMGDVLISLLPASIMGIYNFGQNAYIMILVCIVSCILFEAITEYIFKKALTVKDLSAAVTGLLIALNLPPELPIWMAILGCAFAIVVVKQMFGGIGQNFMNPALAARCFLVMSFTGRMTSFVYDGITTATPLTVMKAGGSTDLLSMFIGNEAGTIGETSAAALLIGALYLLLKRVISIKIPFFYIFTFSVCIFIYAVAGEGMEAGDAGIFLAKHICGGGLILGAFFMATDYTTSPITSSGKVIFGVILGLLTFVLRIYGGSAEGVSYAIIICNLLVPIIEMATRPKSFGFGYEEKPLSENLGFIGGRDSLSGDGIGAIPEGLTPDEENIWIKEKKKEMKRTKSSQRKNSLPYVVISICLIGLFAGLALGAVYDVTKEPIRKTADKNKQESFSTVFPEAASYVENSEIKISDAAKKAKEILNVKADINEIWDALSEDKTTVGHIIIITSHEGYGGDIQMAVGLDTENVITGISMLSIGETAGLGMEAKDDPSFAKQYVGKKVDSFVVTKTGASAENEIDAISQATITSKAVTNAVNMALGFALDMWGGEK